uniref:40S ribosomal protein S30 n=1 Tax=Amorphochlora amoebiformis TaxID=1561963 RepID=A0A0H5BIN8_9EUKA|nr:ribosomal protein S30 [Amorphochlora amoebiformis]
MGKVHGSLTRAGKVKNQTKYVPKSDKKRKIRGRIKFKKKYCKLIKLKYKKNT